MSGTIRDTRMMAQALEQRWPMTDTARKVIINRLLKIVANEKSSSREVTAAAKALLAAEAQNQKDEQHADNRLDASRNRILDLLEQRGSGGGHITFNGGGSEKSEGGNHESRPEAGSG